MPGDRAAEERAAALRARQAVLEARRALARRTRANRAGIGRGKPDAPDPSTDGKRLSDEQITSLLGLGGFGLGEPGQPGQWIPNRDFTPVPCFGWGLAGGDFETMVQPAGIFGPFSKDLMDAGVTVESYEQNLMELDEDHPTRVWMREHLDTLTILQNAYRRGEAEPRAAVQILAEMAVQAQGMSLDPSGTSPFAVCLEYEQEPDERGGYRDSVNWTHWGIQIRKDAKVMTLETFPTTMGMWSSTRTFEEVWGHARAEGEKSTYVVTIPVKDLTPRHYQVLRLFLEDNGLA